ncbi:uncharacterized protein LOC143281233 [Babylonia areolata]|uniref:uncharacterized protein LOC143281233 n=1 Tax=Babylonia areolata TaxID=304850 RepID=UPI003FD5C439
MIFLHFLRTRSSKQARSSEEDDTIDLLMNCAVDGEAVWPGQRHNSLTTLKDGDAAEGMIYSPPLKSPHKEMAADTCNEELEDKTTSGHVCDPPEPDADLTVKTLLLGTSGTENELLKSSDKNDTNESCQTSSPNSAAQEDRSLLKVEITEDVPVTDSQEITQPQRSEDFEPNKVTADIQESSESATQSPKYENHSGKLLMNLGDRTLSLGVDDSSKPVLEMQEAEAMTLFLTKGTLPCESNEDVKRGAGDGRNVDVPGADVSDENQVADEKAGIDAMLDTRSKSSCQLEQIQAVQSEMESVHNIVPLNTELPHNQESIHNIVPHDTQLPQNQQSTENDSSAACAPANHQPQGEPHVMADAGQEADSSTVCGHNTLSHHVIHGAAAASFEEERMADNLLLPERPTSPGAAASEGEWQIVPLHRVFAHTNLGGLAASASPTHSHIHTDGLQETDSDTHQTVDGLGNDSSIFIEVQTAETTNILAPSLPEESLAQLDQTAQAPDSPSPGHPEQDELCSGYGYVPNAYDAAEGNTQDETTNILAPSLPEESVVQQDQTAQASDSLTQGHPEQDELCSGYGDVPNTDDTTEGKTNNETTDSLAPSLLDESLAQQDKTIQPPGSLIHGHPEQNQLCSKFGDVPKTDDPAKYKIQDETSENLEYSVHEANEKGGTEDAQRIVAAVQLQGNGVDTAPEKEQITSDQLTEASALKVHPDAGSDLQDVKAEQE